MNGDCVFCGRIAAGEFRQYDDYSVAFEPLNPVVPGHLLVVSRRHVEDACEMPFVTAKAFGFAAFLAGAKGLESFNLITSAGAAATQTIRHLHVHIVPRREDDGLHLPWTGQVAS